MEYKNTLKTTNNSKTNCFAERAYLGNLHINTPLNVNIYWYTWQEPTSNQHIYFHNLCSAIYSVQQYSRNTEVTQV